MRRARTAWIIAAACAVVAIAVLLGRSTLLTHSSSASGLCNRELRAGQPASLSLTAAAKNEYRLTATPAGTPPPTNIEEDRDIAEARQAGGPTVIATVGGQTITLGELRAQEVIVRTLQTQNERTLTAQALPPSIFRSIAARETLIKQAGVPNVALAALISDDAIYQYAVQQGCQPTAQEVTARVAHDENLMTGGKAADRSLYTSIYGPDYWTMTYPDVIRRLLAKNRLNASLTASLIPPPFSTAEATAPATAWNSLAWRVVQQAHITVKNQTAIAPASVSAALKYLKNYYAAGFGS